MRYRGQRPLAVDVLYALSVMGRGPAESEVISWRTTRPFTRVRRVGNIVAAIAGIRGHTDYWLHRIRGD